MKRKMIVLMGVVALALGLVGTPASWANSLPFQNVTFDLSLNGANLDLRVTNALNADGSWLGIETLGAFAINNFGSASGLTASGGTTWNTELGGLSAGGAGGCNGSGAGWVCFEASPALTLSNDFTVTIASTSGAFNLNLPTDTAGLFGPSLKVFFGGANQGDGHGSLLSQTIPASVPEPASLLLLGAGLAGLGIWRRKANKV